MDIDLHEQMRKEDATIGLSPTNEFLVMTIPIEKYAGDMQNGAALLFGKFRELEAHARQIFAQMRMKKEQGGVIKPKIQTNFSVA